AESEIHDGEASTVAVIDDHDALKVERVREAVATVDAAFEDDVLAAWTFTTMLVRGPMRKWFEQPTVVGADPDPSNIEELGVGQALLDFPLNASLLFTDKVINGTIKSPYFLDRETRALRGDGGYEVVEIPFTMTVPKGIEDGQEVPVVIFGHGLMSERRFVLAVGDALAVQGFATISIDFPFHGERSYCWSEGPLTVPNPTTGEITPIQDPCSDGYACQPDGTCVNEAGEQGPLRKWPIIGMPQASGAAMLEIEHISNTRDHFTQSYVDLKALSRSLRLGNWEPLVGHRLKTDKLYYTGQSLGGILGSVFVSMSPEIDRAVLNVPGADTVELFENSQFFSFQVDAFFKREGIEQFSWEGRRFMNVAKWFMDAVDPHSFVGMLGDENRNVFVQMAMLDFIIPNDNTKRLVEIAGVPRRDYLAEHAFIVIPLEPEYIRGVTEMARYLAGEFSP
ncbi:MAG: hypothetical protein KJO07_15000, partial [Deltaproteobacteria bacterium]|nr:hypothetical protein [Deltaproteobacteria bacterium]